eukprot:comp23185_c0_seq1/m.37591 comp23185_c0_seq1/g.37591  ORF comp23185_c0_seq1/g.37591 comp23185_c0_seq1/m.37591 type:complete len:277 (-) comp23185_c0_seq1:725-1555(-)
MLRVAQRLRLSAAPVRQATRAMQTATEFVPANPARPNEELIRQSWLTRRDPLKEQAARLGTERVALPHVSTLTNQDWDSYGYAQELTTSMHMHGIYRDVLGRRLNPLVNLSVEYPNDVRPVAGNILTPSQLQEPPTIKFSGKEGNKYTIVMTSPDASIYTNVQESLHWMVTDLDHTGQGGRTLVPYLPPAPPKGTGYHRYVFTLLHRKDKTPTVLEEGAYKQYGVFSTREFFKSQRMVYRGVAFFQCAWDESVTKTFTDKLGFASEPNFSQDKYWE